MHINKIENVFNCARGEVASYKNKEKIRMLNAQDIRNLCKEELTFTRGLNLYEKNKIRSFKVKNKKDEMIEIYGEVEGSYGNKYEVGAKIKGKVIYKNCQCPSFYETGRMCKHVVAMLLRYTDEEHQLEKKYKQLLERTQYRYGDNMLNYYEQELMKEMTNEKLQDPIQVYPKLYFDYKEDLGLGISVGDKKSYIVKDIYQFVRNIVEEEQIVYGKNLAFVHRLDNFDQKAHPLIKFIIDKVTEYTLFLEQTGSYGRSMRFSKKMLPLLPKAFDELFTLLKGQSIECNTHTEPIAFIEENPKIEFTMKEEKGKFILRTELENYKLIEHPNCKYIGVGQTFYKCKSAFATTLFPILDLLQQLDDEEQAKAFLFDERGVQRFALTVLPKLRKYANVIVEEHILEKYAPIPLEIKVYLDKDKLGSIVGSCSFEYGEILFNPYDLETKEPTQVVRNVEKEQQFNNILYNYQFKTNKGKLYLADEEEIYHFLTQGINDLLAISEVSITDALRTMHLTKPPIGAIGIKINNHLLEINFEAIEMPLEDIENILKAYQIKKKYYRLKDGSFIDLQNPAVEEMSHLLEGLNLTVKDLAKGKVSLQKYRALYLDQITKANESITVERDKYFKQLIRDVKNVEDADYEVPDILRGILRSYQKTGYRWLKTMAHYGFGGILADDMGLGKTLQVIALVLSEEKENQEPSLVVAPTSLVLNWKKEIERFAPSLKVLILTGDGESRKELIKQLLDYNVVITSYELLKRDIEYYENVHFKYCIADEAHYIKNPNTQNAKALKGIKRSCSFALTGTPIENTLAELWSIFDFVMPHYLFTYHHFKNKFEMPIVKNESQDTIVRLQKMIAPFILRRLKKDVLKELPNKTETVIYNRMESEQSAIYKAQLALFKHELDQELKENGFGKSQIKVLALITRLRQLCCHPRLYLENYKGESSKLKQCIEIVKDSIEAGHKILLFSQFTSMLELIAQAFNEEEIPYYILTGQTKAEKRIGMVETFNKDETPVFLISLKAGGTGLNLTGADIVIHYDPWWNLSSQNQATDRAYRIGQKNNVQVFTMITENTIEEKIKKLQDKKIGLTESVLKEGESFVNKMTQEEIQALFTLE